MKCKFSLCMDLTQGGNNFYNIGIFRRIENFDFGEIKKFIDRLNIFDERPYVNLLEIINNGSGMFGIAFFE